MTPDKTTGFLDHPRRPAPARPPARRVGDWGEFVDPLPPGHDREQAARCMDCGIPFCHQGCPLGNPIPEFNDHVYRGRWRAAWQALDATNDFPEFTGRLCPAPCEKSCVLAINDEPVTIEHIEKTIIERAFAEGWVRPRPPGRRTGKRVAVVGSGPAGLAAAHQLNRAGHLVTVYEADDRLGGLLRYGIPDFKIDKAIVDRRLDLMQAEGVRFRTGVRIGDGIPWQTLRSTHDGIVIAIGAPKPRTLDIPGADLPGVHRAMDYLIGQNRALAADPSGRTRPPIDAAGKRVIILGDGDTGVDCLGTAHRQGAAHVTQIGRKPLPPEARPLDNPWPQWPLVFETQSSHEEGGDRQWGLLARAFEGDGRLERLVADRVTRVDGRVVPLPGDPVVIPCDLAFVAVGFTGPDAEGLTRALGVELTPRGTLAVDARFAAGPGIYAVGDAVRGASLIVWAISHGREAARHLDAELRGGLPVLPTRGEDRPFGGPG